MGIGAKTTEELDLSWAPEIEETLSTSGEMSSLADDVSAEWPDEGGLEEEVFAYFTFSLDLFLASYFGLTLCERLWVLLAESP